MKPVVVEVLTTLSVRGGGESWQLLAGDRLALSPQEAQRLLEAAPGRVQILPSSTSESTLDGPLSVYWQRESGEIVGPGVVQYAIADKHSVAWFLVSHGDEASWIRGSQIRSNMED